MRTVGTGGAGFIDSNLVNCLLGLGHEVTVLDDLSSGFRKNLQADPRLTFVEGDVRDRKAVRRAMAGASWAFHLAASVGNKRSIDDPFHDAEVNVLGTLNVLEEVRRAGVGRLVVSSSAGIFEVLLRAFAMLGKDFAALRLKVAGRVLEGRTFRSLQELAASLGIQHRVEFLGEVDHDHLSRLYREASVFVMPSKRETFGNPLVEAMASGTPVIASDLAVCREICGDAALYFPPSDPVALAEKLRAVLIEPSLQEELSRRGLVQSLEYSWPKAARNIIRILEGARGETSEEASFTIDQSRRATTT